MTVPPGVTRRTANQLTKLDVARQQLGTAMELFIRDRDPVSVQCLACGGAELIEAIAGLNNVEPLSTHMLETVPGMDTKSLRNIQRQYWNAFKHMTDFGGQPRDDTETLAAFDDSPADVPRPRMIAQNTPGHCRRQKLHPQWR